MSRHAFAVAILLGHALALWALASSTAVKRPLAVPAAIEAIVVQPPSRPPPPTPLQEPPRLREDLAPVLVPQIHIDLPADVAAPASSAAATASGRSSTGGLAAVRSSSPMQFLGAPNTDDYYSAVSRKAGEQGTVALRVCVSAQGTVAGIDVISSSHYSRLDEAAAQIARLSRWKVATVDGQPMPGCERFNIGFHLQH